MKRTPDDRSHDADAVRKGERLYAWVARSLRDRIISGNYMAGTQIPAEDRLAEEFAVSRSTIRQALRQLQGDRLIESRKGSGSLVLPPPAAGSQILHATSIDDLLAFSRGYEFHIEAMGIETIRADLATTAGLAPAGEWLTLKGVGKSDNLGPPDCWAEYYIRKDFAAIERLLTNPVVSPIFPLIEKRFGIRIVEVRQEMSAAAISPAQASVLDVKPDSGAIAVQRIYTTSSREVALATLAIYPAHRFSHSITLRRAE